MKPSGRNAARRLPATGEAIGEIVEVEHDVSSSSEVPIT